MRQTALLAAAPFVLLAGCGDAEPVGERDAQPMEVVPAEVVPPPEVPENSLETVDFAGSYSRMGASIELNEDDTYRYTNAGGDSFTGSFTRMEDGSRIRLEDFDDGPAWFSVGRLSIYRLADEDTPYNEIVDADEFHRDVSAPVPPPVADEAAQPET